MKQKALIFFIFIVLSFFYAQQKNVFAHSTEKLKENDIKKISLLYSISSQEEGTVVEPKLSPALTPSPVPSALPSGSPIVVASPTIAPSSTTSPLPSIVPSILPSILPATPTPLPVEVTSPSPSPSGTPSPTPSPSPSLLPSPSPSDLPIGMGGLTPVSTSPTPSPTPSPSSTPSPVPTPSATSSPSLSSKPVVPETLKPVPLTPFPKFVPKKNVGVVLGWHDTHQNKIVQAIQEKQSIFDPNFFYHPFHSDTFYTTSSKAPASTPELIVAGISMISIGGYLTKSYLAVLLASV